VAEVKISDGPPMLKTEMRGSRAGCNVDIRGRDLSSAVRDMQRAVAEKVKLPAGTSISWSGQFEFLERATARLKIVVPGRSRSSSRCSISRFVALPRLCSSW